MSADDEDLTAVLERLAHVAARPGLAALLLIGSRARGDHHAGSDWDFGVLRAARTEGSELDLLALRADLSGALASDDVDLVDLARASALLRYQAARDGHVVVEPEEGSVLHFRTEATLFWCDVECVVTRAQAAVLAELGET